MEEKIVTIINKMADYLNISQMKKLQEVLLQTFSENTIQKEEISNNEYLQLFLDAKRIEGCSERTIQYYSVTVVRMLQKIETPVRKISTEEIRKYLVDYQKINDCSKVTVDNVRRNISSFFSWLEEEDYILKSPMKRIHKIKTKQPVKEIISDEAIELLRDHCQCPRDLAMIDLLYSTGIRVGELVNLNISDVDFEARECVVFGKGDKERKVYFDAKGFNSRILNIEITSTYIPFLTHENSEILQISFSFSLISAMQVFKSDVKYKYAIFSLLNLKLFVISIGGTPISFLK